MSVDLHEEATELVESWINGNREDVAKRLEAAGRVGYGAALALAMIDGDREGAMLQETDIADLSAYMARRAER